MKQFILLGILLSAFVSCTKYNQIDTGLAKAKFNGNMYEYFQSNSYDWDSLLVLIEYTGVKEYFTGEKEGYENITFFGPTNHSIRRKMFEKSHWNSNYTEKIYDYHSMREFVDGVGVEQCRTWILRHIVKGITKYRTMIHINGNYLVGTYSSEEKAAVAYNKAVDLAKAAGIKKDFPENYVDTLPPKEYAEVYTKIKLSERYLSYLEEFSNSPA